VLSDSPRTPYVPDVAVDNDVLIKAACYGLTTELDASRSLGVLGAAKYVVAGRIERMALCGDRDAARNAALDLIGRSSVLEPSRDELVLATAIETAAQRRGIELDAGESQLAAMIVYRGIAVLETGDKRAIKGFELLLDELSDLDALRGRLRCLEQIVARCLGAVGSDALARAICAEPRVDTTLSICFRCFSSPPHDAVLDRDGLDSYIATLRACSNRSSRASRAHEDRERLHQLGHKPDLLGRALRAVVVRRLVDDLEHGLVDPALDVLVAAPAAAVTDGHARL
jgi:hypothetical protein